MLQLSSQTFCTDQLHLCVQDSEDTLPQMLTQCLETLGSIRGMGVGDMCVSFTALSLALGILFSTVSIIYL